MIIEQISLEDENDSDMEAQIASENKDIQTIDMNTIGFNQKLAIIKEEDFQISIASISHFGLFEIRYSHEIL